MNGIKLRKKALTLRCVIDSYFSNNSVKKSSSFLFKTFLIAAFTVAFGISESYAQERVEVSGIVTDATDGSPLPGASIVVLESDEVTGTMIGTTTGMDGSYTISVPPSLNVLRVTFIGYIPQNVTIDGRSEINIALQQDIRLLDDVVVVGYGVQDQREITSSVATLNLEEFNKGNISDPSQLLQGKVAGLIVNNRGGNPNRSSTLRLRGLSTVGANTEPLIVIDGVLGASLDNVDPNDIASIDVLKDGSASAIYGTRGSSGVILVTTKTGQASADGSSQVRAEYNGYVSSSSVYKNQPVMSASEYINAGGNDLGSVNDWQDLVTRTGISNVHNLAVAGGSSNTTYRVSTNFRNVQGILENSGFEQLNARANLNHRALNDRLNLTLNASATKRDRTNSFEEALRYAVLYNPTAPVRFDNGEFFQAILFDNYNPAAIIEQNVSEGENTRLNFNVIANLSLTDNLEVSANVARQFQSSSNAEYYPSTSFFRGLDPGGLAVRFNDDSDFTLFESYATFRDAISQRINLTATGGYSFQEQFYQNLRVALGNFPTDVNGYHDIDLSGDRVIGGTGNVDIQSFASPDERIIAFFGRVNLTFDESIFLNASFRREGSTKLGPNNQWGNFPALSVGADLARYMDVDKISQLKVRLGYGVTGALPSQNGLSQDLFNYSFAGGGTVSRARDGNLDLKWEEKTEINLGVDFGLLDDRITGSIDVYTRDIDDFILEVAVPTDQFPSGSQVQNAGSLQTQGLEILVNYDAYRSSNFQWDTGIVFDTYRTELKEFITDQQMRANLGSPGQNSTNLIRVKEGEEIGQIWGPVFDGVDSNGAPIFKDINGDGQVISAQGDALNENADFQVLGNGIPDFSLGWTNQMNYKNWDLNFLIRGVFGHSLVNTFRAFYEPIDPGAINSYNRVITSKAVDGLMFSQFSSLYVERADFVKLDNITLAYNFDVNTFDFLSRLSAYVTAENLFTITNYTGIDPEPVLLDRESGNDVLSPGIDRRTNYFSARTFSIGINVGF
tara:strand:- start:92250 stop:95294 length:3045 start_codon:yes stop_codon:yes gene_type:complete